MANEIPVSKPSFFGRVAANDSARKGAAALLAGVLIAVVSEALWPTHQ
jgi:hypothetical protein